MSHESHTKSTEQIFTGNIFIFHAFDVGDDINLEKIEQLSTVKTIPLTLPKYFKKYHTPVAIELPHPHSGSKCISCKIHSFGAVSLTYKIPFSDTLENIKTTLQELDNNYIEQSVIDVKSIFKRIQGCIAQPKFFQAKSSYLVIQVDPKPTTISINELKEKSGGIIASSLRFETQTLSEYQKNEILESATGYFRGDLIIIDTDAAFVYDKEYEDILDFFEFANIQLLELRYFDWLLDQKLNTIYEEDVHHTPLRNYLPLIGLFSSDPLAGLGQLKADISVIIERLEDTIKLAGEPYFFELYDLLEERLDIKSWYDAINRKLDITKDMRQVYQHRTDVIRENILSVLIVILIFIELVVGILHYFK